jgi:hypothetical protein
MRATGRPSPPAFADAVMTVLAEDVAQYTGGALAGAPVAHKDFPAGALIHHPDDTLKTGNITIAYLDAEGLSIGAIDHGGISGIFAGHVQLLRPGSYMMELASHEIAHTLGYYHPCGGEQVPLPSTMRIASRPTDADRLHGRILYRRPSNSRSPDIDPDSFTANARTSVVVSR